MKRTLAFIKNWLTRQWQMCTDRENRWLSVPVTIAALLVLLVCVKSCQGIVYGRSNECKIRMAGYPVDDARALAAALNNEQIDSLIARHEVDTLAHAVVNGRYFISDNFYRYLDFHKSDTTRASADDIIAIVNVGADRRWEDTSAHCDTTKGYLILINKYHYLNEQYKPADLVSFIKACSYGENKAAKAVVDAFDRMQQECMEKTKTQLMISSAYRSFHEQESTHKRYNKKLVAEAGFSEHQSGLSIDITSLQHPEKWDFGKSPEGKWVHENCHKYGFILRYPEGKAHITGYDYEPWHLRYVGVDAATRIHDEGITLDEYYAYYIEREKE